jgi:hypothetical protein
MLLGDGNDRGMQLPQCCHLRGTTVVFEIFKGHAQDCHWQGLRQFTAMLGVELKPMFRQLGLRILAGTAKFVVNRCFHDDPRCKSENLNNTTMVSNGNTVDDYSREDPVKSNSVPYRSYTAFTL